MSFVDYEMELTVITMTDGLKHDYFSYISWYKDNYSPLGTGRLVMALDSAPLKYWYNYHDVVVISAKLKNSKQNTNSKDYYKKIISERTKNQATQKQTKYSKQQKETIMKIFKQKITDDECNFSFIGRVSEINKRGQKVIIELEDIGWKFMQHVPDDFRKKYIAGQTVDNAFQAMCEFMGVEFAYSLNALGEYSFGSDGFSIVKDSQTIEKVPNLLQEIQDDKTEVMDASKITEDVESAKLAKKQKKTSKKNEDSSDKSIASSAVNSKKQESSSGPSTNVEDAEEKLKHAIDFESRIKDLFIGNTYYNSDLTNLTFDYGAITVQPKTTSDSSTMKKVEDPISQDPKDPKAAKKRIQGNTKYRLSDNPNVATLQHTAQLGQQSRLTSGQPSNMYLTNRQIISARK